MLSGRQRDDLLADRVPEGQRRREVQHHAERRRCRPVQGEGLQARRVIELERNATYHGGEPYLDGVKFVTIPGAQATLRRDQDRHLASRVRRRLRGHGEGQGRQVRDEHDAVGGGQHDQHELGYRGRLRGRHSPPNLCAGKPDGEKVKAKTATSDIRVRRAVAAAVDPKVINERVYQGTALPNSSPFANSPWDPKVEGPKADLDEAKRLVTEAKTAGWDGKIRVMAANTPEGTNWAEAVRSQLVSAGMDVTVDNTKDTAGVVNQVLTLRDYDLASWGYAILDDVDAAYTALLASFNSKTLRYGFGNADFDAAVELLRTADTDPKRVEAYKKVSEIWIRDLPAHVMTALPQGWIHSPKLHGVQRNAYTSYHLDKAWLEK